MAFQSEDGGGGGGGGGGDHDERCGDGPVFPTTEWRSPTAMLNEDGTEAESGAAPSLPDDNPAISGRRRVGAIVTRAGFPALFVVAMCFVEMMAFVPQSLPPSHEFPPADVGDMVGVPDIGAEPAMEVRALIEPDQDQDQDTVEMAMIDEQQVVEQLDVTVEEEQRSFTPQQQQPMIAMPQQQQQQVEGGSSRAQESVLSEGQRKWHSIPKQERTSNDVPRAEPGPSRQQHQQQQEQAQAGRQQPRQTNQWASLSPEEVQRRKDAWASLSPEEQRERQKRQERLRRKQDDEKILQQKERLRQQQERLKEQAITQERAREEKIFRGQKGPKRREGIPADAPARSGEGAALDARIEDVPPTVGEVAVPALEVNEQRTPQLLQPRLRTIAADLEVRAPSSLEGPIPATDQAPPSLEDRPFLSQQMENVRANSEDGGAWSNGATGLRSLGALVIVSCLLLAMHLA